MQFMTPKVAKVGICLAAVLGLIYVVLVVGERNVEADRAVRAAEGIELTSQQAGDMTQTADAVGALIEDTVAEVSPSATSAGSTPAVGVELAKSEEWYVRRADELSSRWGPRYEAATRDIDKFEHRFVTTKDRLQEYFRKQSEITESVSSPDLKAVLRSRDAEEQAAYARWIKEGQRLLDQARNMRISLDDMDAVIRKQQLTVNMLTEYSHVSTIPGSAKSLYASLGEFRRQSDELANDLSNQVFSVE